MTGRDDADGSFDPRTWMNAAGPGTAPAVPEREPQAAVGAASFDPKSWLADPAPAAVEEQPPAAAPKSAKPRWKAAAGVAGAAICLVGAGFALSTKKAPEEQVAAAPAAAADAPIAAEPEQELAGRGGSRTINIGDPGQIRASLLYAGIPQAEAERAAAQAAAALGPQPGEIRLSFQLETSGDASRLTGLEATRLDGSGVRLVAAENGFRAERLAAKLEVRTFARSGEMDESSFYTSAVAAGITDSLISDFAKAFSFDFDFQREVSPGDRFEAVFQQAVNPAGQAVGEPRLLYVSLTTPEKSRRFYRFTAPGEAEAGWFDDNGRSTVRSLMRTPVDGARVSSRFGNRVHPITGYVKAHRGIDFAAPTGTPIYAAGSGVVEKASFSGSCAKCGAGNMVRLRHDNGLTTHYFHLSAFAPGMAVGHRVPQGQVIGLVGSTGGSTGPHLHYEVIRDGDYLDPLTIDTGTGVSLAGGALEAFRKERDRIDLARSQQAG